MEKVEQKSIELRGEKQTGNVSQDALEELKKGQELLKEEVNQLKSQMSLIIQILLKGEDNSTLCLPHAYPAPQTPQPWMIPLHQ
jgi:hypothetical protein